MFIQLQDLVVRCIYRSFIIFSTLALYHHADVTVIYYAVSQLVIVEMSCIVIFDQGLKEPPECNHTEHQIYALATRWRAGLLRYRQSEFTCSEVNDLGLRVVSKNYSGPQLTEMCLPSAR